MSWGKNVLDRTNKSTKNRSNYLKDKNPRESAIFFCWVCTSKAYLFSTTLSKPFHKK
jgi:hypothetical protein